MKLLTRVGAIFDRVIDAFAFLAAVILVFIWGVVASEVIVRFLVNYSIIWAYNVGEICLFAAPFLAAAWLLKKERHVKIDLVHSRLKPRVQAILDTIMSTIGIVICLCLVWYGTKVTLTDFQENIISDDVLKSVVWPRYAIIPLSCLLLLIQFCRRAYGNLLLWQRLKGKEVAPSQEQLDLKGEA